MSEDNEHIEEDEVDTGAEGEGEEHAEPEETEGEEQEETEENEGDEEESSEEASIKAAPSKAASRIAALSKRTKEAEERAIRAETLAEERAQSRQPQVDNSAAQRQREEKLSLMDPSERREFLQAEKIQTMEQQILLTQLQTQDALDRNSYETRANRDAVFRKHADEVEKRLRAERQAGRNWNREVILAQIVGEAALKAKPNTKQKEEAKERVNSAKAPSPSGRSNSNAYKPGRRDESVEDMERRLGGVTF